MTRIDPEGTRLPIKIDSTSNGEYPPIPVGERNLGGQSRRTERATDNARHLSMTPAQLSRVERRRGEHAPRVQRSERRGGQDLGAFYDIPRDAALDNDMARTSWKGRSSSSMSMDISPIPPAPGSRRCRRDKSPVLNPTPGHLGGTIHQGRVPRQRHRHDGADLHSVHVGCGAAHYRRSRGDAEDHRQPGRDQAAADPRPGQPQPGGRHRSDGAADKRYGVVGWKTYTQWGPADNAYYSLETGLGFELTDERYGRSVHRAGPLDRRPEHLHSQGNSVRPRCELQVLAL